MPSIAHWLHLRNGSLQAVAVDMERTVEQDLMFAFRVIVHIASASAGN
jgi:uncharacterized membrane protein